MRASLPVTAAGTGTGKRSGSWFSRMATATASWTGKPMAFLLASAIVLVWGISGPIFHYSDTWQLVINTGTTIVTFLMVFLIQNTQNRDTLTIQVKLSELILAIDGANNRMADIEDAPDKELEAANEAIKEKAHQ
jgi:low affinity Fe/Cu permease